MPELPEVECVRRGLARAKLHAPITRVWRSEQLLRTGKLWRQERLRAIAGGTGGRWVRRGKFLLWRLQTSRGDTGLLVHLGMTGRLQVTTPSAPALAHTHVRISMADGRQLRFVDPRRFGGLRAGAWAQLHDAPPLSELGPEPLSRQFDGAVLRQRAGRSKRALCSALLDQKVVAGLGNIYVQEALYVAGLRPLQRATGLRVADWDRLADAIVEVLTQGIRNGGTTLRDYRDADGRSGRNQARLRVYGRAGQACACGAVLRGYEVGGRRGAWCPAEQR